MKKGLVLVALASLSLASCGGEEPSTTKNYDTVMKETQASIVAELTPDFEIVKEGTSVADIKVDIKSPEADFNITWKVNNKYNLNSNESESVIDLSVNGKAEWQEASWKIKATLSVISDTIYGKLEELSVNIPEELGSPEMITAMVDPYLNKWFSVKLDAETIKMLGLDSQKTLQKLKEFGDLFAKTPLFELVKENENETHYDYDVKLNAGNLFTLLKKYADIAGRGDEIPGTVKVEMEKELANSKLNINVKVDKKDSSSFVMTFTDKEGKGKAEIKNSKNELIIDIMALEENEWAKIVIDKKDASSKGITGKMSATTNGKTMDLFTFVYKLDRLESKVGFNMDLSNIAPTPDAGVIDIMIEEKVKEEKVSFETPKESEDLTPLVAPILQQMKMMNQQSMYNLWNEIEVTTTPDMGGELTPEQLEELNKMMEEANK